MGFDYEEEQKKIMTELMEEFKQTIGTAENNARAQGEAQLIQSRYQLEAQITAEKIMSEEQKRNNPMGDPNAMAAGGQMPMAGQDSNTVGGFTGQQQTDYSQAPEGMPQINQELQGSVDWDKTALKYAKKIINMDPTKQQEYLNQVSAETPSLYQLIMSKINELQSGVAQATESIKKIPKEPNKVKPGKTQGEGKGAK